MSLSLSTDALEPSSAGPLDLNHVSLFLDVDGTIAPIVSRPEQVIAVPTRTALLKSLRRQLGGRLAVVSGRAIDDVDRILDASVVAVAGVHGLQRRCADGRLYQSTPHPGLKPIKEALIPLIQIWPGVLIEDKGLSIAVHYRNQPEAAEVIDAQARRLAASQGVTVQAGDKVIELRTPGQNKGDALRAFMAEPPFTGSIPVFVGDDLTDEPAFEAAAQLGGFGVLVGPGRPTQAERRLANPAAVLTWLTQATLAETNR